MALLGVWAWAKKDVAKWKTAGKTANTIITSKWFYIPLVVGGIWWLMAPKVQNYLKESGVAQRAEAEQKAAALADTETLTRRSSYREYNLPAGTCTPTIEPAEGASYFGWQDPDGGPLRDGCAWLHFNGSPSGHRLCNPGPELNVDAILGGPGRFQSLKVCSESPRLDVVIYAKF